MQNQVCSPIIEASTEFRDLNSISLHAHFLPNPPIPSTTNSEWRKKASHHPKFQLTDSNWQLKAKSRTIAVRLISMALTGYYKTLVRPRTHRPLSMLKYDPVGMCLSLLYMVSMPAQGGEMLSKEWRNADWISRLTNSTQCGRKSYFWSRSAVVVVDDSEVSPLTWILGEETVNEERIRTPKGLWITEARSLYG
jgi:hypothetical protein